MKIYTRPLLCIGCITLAFHAITLIPPYRFNPSQVSSHSSVSTLLVSPFFASLPWSPGSHILDHLALQPTSPRFFLTISSALLLSSFVHCFPVFPALCRNVSHFIYLYRSFYILFFSVIVFHIVFSAVPQPSLSFDDLFRLRPVTILTTLSADSRFVSRAHYWNANTNTPTHDSLSSHVRWLRSSGNLEWLWFFLSCSDICFGVSSNVMVPLRVSSYPQTLTTLALHRTRHTELVT